MKASKIVKYAVSVALAAVRLYFSFRNVEWSAFIASLNTCRWGYVALAMAVSIAAFYFRSCRWKCLLRPIDPTMDGLTTFNGVNIGYLANFVFPRIGEVIRCGFVHKRSLSRHKDDPENAATFDKTLGTVLMSRSWDVATVFVLLAVLLAFRGAQFGEFFRRSIWTPLQERLDFNWWWIIAAVALAAVVIVLIKKSKGFFRGVADGFLSWAKMPGKWRFFVWTVLLWAAYVMMSWLIMLAIPATEGLGLADGLFVCLAGSLAWMVPAPGGFGAYHYIVALAVSSVYCLSWDSGIMLATLNHESQAVTMIVCGIMSYIIECFRK